MSRVLDSLSNSLNTAIEAFIKLPWYAQLGIAIFIIIFILRAAAEIYKRLWWEVK